MEFDVRWVDVTGNLVSQQQPVFMLERQQTHSDKSWAGQTQIAKLGEFWVPDGDLFNDNAKWSCTKTGDVVRVPIVAYKTVRAMSAVAGLVLQIGLAAAVDLRKHTQDVPTVATLVIGHQISDLAPVEDAFRCYIGIALRTR